MKRVSHLEVVTIELSVWKMIASKRLDVINKNEGEFQDLGNSNTASWKEKRRTRKGP